MRTRLIYTHFVSGHNIEYLHHLYLGALADVAHNYIFAVPQEFESQKDLMEWEPSSNVTFHYISHEASRTGNILVNAWNSCRQLARVAKATNASEVILISLMDFMPFIQLLMPRSIIVRGILYRIYLYYFSEMKWWQQLTEKIKMFVITHSSCVSDIYVLNDENSAHELNRRWHTKKFCYLPDPCVLLDKSDLRDMREELDIEKGKKIVLHIGSINYNKGFDRVFDMIKHSDEDDLRDYCFVFAGKIASECKPLFCQMLEQCQRKATIIVKDKFLTYQEMGSLIYTADKVVLPYRRFGQSSGIIAYCAQLRTPAYVPDKGLIGRLVEKYQIGIGVAAFNDIHAINADIKIGGEYCKSHSVKAFYQTILG